MDYPKNVLASVAALWAKLERIVEILGSLFAPSGRRWSPVSQAAVAMRRLLGRVPR